MRFFTSRMLTSAVASLLLLASTVSAHSWIICTDYNPRDQGLGPQGPGDTDPARRIFDSSKCDGWSPNLQSAFFDVRNDANFGVDFGFEDRPGFSNELCLSRPNRYTPNLPQATYQSGQIVTLVHPAKNHVAAATTNVWIPDNGINVYMAPLGSPVEGTGYPSSQAYRSNGPLRHFNGNHTNGQIDYSGFQNCPNFDNNNDRATCTMDFQLPDNLAPGEYFFAWHWEFNQGEHYSTCWSAMVTADGGPQTTQTQSTQTQPTQTESTQTQPTQTQPTQTQPTQTQPQTTQPTEPVVTVPGAECSLDARALCSKGLTPPRGTCVVTDPNDPVNGYICECAEGYETPGNPKTCNLESGVRIRIVLRVEYNAITNFPLFERALELELADRLSVAIERLSITFSEGTEGEETGLVVAILTVAGASNQGDTTAQTFFDQLRDQPDNDRHNFGAMSNAVSIRCIDCPEEEVTSEPSEPGLPEETTAAPSDGAASENASNALAPSLALIVAAAVSSLLH